MYKKPNPIKQLVEKGKMLSSAKGSSNYMKEDPGSPAKALKPGIKQFFNDIGQGITNHMMTSPNEKKRQKARAAFNTRLKKDNKELGSVQSQKANIASYFKGFESKKSSTPISDPAPTSNKTTSTKSVSTPRKKVKSVGSPGGVTGTTVRKTGGGMTGTKVRVSPEIKGGATDKDIKKAASKIKDTKTKSKDEIRSAKTTAKQAGKSKQEIRLAKTKAKAKNARIETTSKETAAQGGKKAQEKRAKTIRLEKRAKRIEARIAKRKAKK